ncbi:KaiC domain-containing protein [Salinigranum sp. GCM10025319]|uniref:KaiC domain-containing protein n=1 Tax=Salinigranum sp. GCM10025319 TaxID=3252687 RepID=UPI00361DCDE3
MSNDDDWFERAFADEADEHDPDAGSGVDPDADAGTASERTIGSSADPAVDGEGDADADSPFEEDFSAAFNRAPTPDAAGGNTPNVGDQSGIFGDQDDLDFSREGFDDSEFDSDLDRLDIGIEGLDDMILGGVPTRSLIAAIGSAGTGKTTIGMQFLNTALENGERGVYITLEESRDRVLSTAAEKGWEFRDYEAEGTLAVVDLDPVEMANSLASIRNDLTRLIEEFDAERLVLDSVSLLEMMYDHPARRRSEVFQFTRALKRAGVTTLVTSEASDADPFASRHGIIEYLADAVFVLQYVRSDFQETRLAIEIQKIRDANHSRQPKPYEITNEGISVHQQANLF